MSTQVWMVRAGKDAIYVEEFFSKNIVAIGWGVIGDLKHVHGRDQIGLLLQKHFPEYNKHQLSASAGQIHRFREELVPGEIVLTYDPDTRLYRCGKIEGDYQYKPELPEELQHTRPVSWNGSVRRDDLTPESKNSLGAISTIFCISKVAGEEIVSLVKAGIPDQTEGPVPSEVVQEEEAEVRENTEQRALEFLQDRLSRLDWDDMQELAAGLLRAMGYKTRVSPPGPDRGKDIIASPDGFGFQSPRILVEVKHRKGRMGAPEIRSFTGGLRQGDNGLYISTGGFTREARYEEDRANHHLILMDIEDLSKSIVEYYDKMDTQSRALLPLKKIYWPA